MPPATRASAVMAAGFPVLRGLALGYMLSPATRASAVMAAGFPGLRGLALGYMLPPATRVNRYEGYYAVG